MRNVNNINIRNRYIFRKPAFVLAAALSTGMGIASPGFAREGSFLVDLNTKQVTEFASLGGGHTHASDINNSGQVVGASNTSTGETHAFITGPGGIGMRDLGTIAGSFSYGSGINAAGQVVGQSDTSTGPHAFITGPNGAGMRVVTGGESWGADINSAGQVVGFSYAISGNTFITGPNGVGARGLGTLGGDFGGGANGINDAGRVAGTSDTNMGLHAFITGPNGMDMTDLGTLGGYYSQAYDINATGQVIGFSATSEGKDHAFITGSNGMDMTDLGTLGGDSSAAWVSTLPDRWLESLLPRVTVELMLS
ncbi:MAG: HAF repeat-containing protein [Nitrosospira multiformis]|nr:HAF repeat-containing protein [Nitrosospira multiformis]